MSRKKLFICLSVFAFLSCSPWVAQGKDLYPWTDYFGSSYWGRNAPRKAGIYREIRAKKPPWGRTIRGLGRWGTGISLIRGGKIAAMDKGTRFGYLEEDVMSLIPDRDVIVNIGGMPMGPNRNRLKEYMTMIETDSGGLWKDVVYRQASRLGKLPKGGERIYWGLGNEINGLNFSGTLRALVGRDEVLPHRNDPFVIPYYVEYFFAPTVEALSMAGKDLFGKEGKVNILLGTIQRGYLEESRRWLSDLLSYEIRGDFAKSLAKRKVYELTDVIGVHYVASRDDLNWQKVWSSLYDRWLGRGRIRGIWATEELDKKRSLKEGGGAATAMKVFARYLHLWQRRSITPTEGRCLLWGWDFGEPHNTADFAMNKLLGFAGDSPLVEHENTFFAVPGIGLENYLFELKTNPDKRVAVVFPTDPGDSILVNEFSMKSERYSGQIRATAHVFSTTGHTSLPVSVVKKKDIYTLSAGEDIYLSNQAAVVLFIQRSNN